MAARLFTGARGPLSFKARVPEDNSTVQVGSCRCCGGFVRRSWRTGRLHRFCFTCRYLRMIYGPSISVTRNDQTALTTARSAR